MSEYLLYLENLDGVTTAEQHRMMGLNAFMSRSTSLSPSNSFQATPGVKSSATDSCKVSQTAAGANMAVDISSGQVYVQPASSTRFGCYVWTNTDIVNVPIGASDATQDRIDVVGIRVTDTQYGDGADSLTPVVIVGTLSGTPVAPTLPDGFTPLAQVLVTHGATTILNAKISQYSFAQGHPAAAGGWMTLGAINNGSIPVTYPTNPVPGQVVVDQVTGVIQYASGYYGTTVWRPLSATGLTKTWTPVLTATVTNPTLGIGAGLIQSGRYRYITPKLVWFTLTLNFGTTGRNAGSGRYRISLPLPANANSVANCGFIHGRYVNSAATDNIVTGLKIASSDTFGLSYWDPVTHTTNTVSESAPFAPTAGSGFQITGIYEVA